MTTKSAFRSAIAVALGAAPSSPVSGRTGWRARCSWTAAATGLVAAIALVLGKHEAEYSSVFEILGLTVMFATLFALSAWLFRSASRRSRATPTGPDVDRGWRRSHRVSQVEGRYEA